MNAVAPSLEASVGPAVEEPVAWDWEHLDRDVRPRLVRLATTRYRLSREDAEDLVQDLFEAILEKRPRARSPEAYLLTAFLHRCYDLLQTKGRRSRHEMPLLIDEVRDDRTPHLIFVALVVSGGFRRITPECRGLITAYCLEERSLRETAHDAGCSEKAVWKRINQCLRRLTQCLAT
jgi:RNA polymerase sigma factor (sigma-70 family)